MALICLLYIKQKYMFLVFINRSKYFCFYKKDPNARALKSRHFLFFQLCGSLQNKVMEKINMYVYNMHICSLFKTPTSSHKTYTRNKAVHDICLLYSSDYFKVRQRFISLICKILLKKLCGDSSLSFRNLIM